MARWKPVRFARSAWNRLAAVIWAQSAGAGYVMACSILRVYAYNAKMPTATANGTLCIVTGSAKAQRSADVHFLHYVPHTTENHAQHLIEETRLPSY